MKYACYNEKCDMRKTIVHRVISYVLSTPVCGSCKEKLYAMDCKGWWISGGTNKVAFSPKFSIGEEAFAYWEGLKSVVIGPNGYVHFKAFSECNFLESVVIDSDTRVEMFSFAGCKRLQLVIIDSGTRVGELAFTDCTGLKSVFIGLAATIGPFAFWGCTRLEEVFIDLDNPPPHPGVTTIGLNAFDNCPKLKSVYVMCSNKRHLETECSDWVLKYQKSFGRACRIFFLERDYTIKVNTDLPGQSLERSLSQSNVLLLMGALSSHPLHRKSLFHLDPPGREVPNPAYDAYQRIDQDPKSTPRWRHSR